MEAQRFHGTFVVPWERFGVPRNLLCCMLTNRNHHVENMCGDGFIGAHVIFLMFMLDTRAKRIQQTQ